MIFPISPLIESSFRNSIRWILTGEKEFVLKAKTPSLEDLQREFDDISELGLYLHIPFCEQICSYCPYNKEIYRYETARDYTNAVKKEIDLYSNIIGDKPVTSLYIGGGTPTTMLYSGIKEILYYIFKTFNIKCGIHMESHPNHLTKRNLRNICEIGVNNISMGVEALQDNYLKFLGRPYTVEEVLIAINNTVSMDFECVNLDFIFALPNQTYKDIEEAGSILTSLGIDQVAAYPLFYFPYTKMGEKHKNNNYDIKLIFKRRKMLSILENIFYSAGFERTSVWAFTKKGVPKYCSVTVPLYVGLGASGGTYLRKIFFINTFNVSEYIKTCNNGMLPIALSINLSEKMQMAWWLYWRIYKTRFKKSNFKDRFGIEFDKIYGKYIKMLRLLNFLDFGSKDEVVLTDRGAYWLHVIEDFFSIDYISKLWGTSKYEPWPIEVRL